MPFCLEFRRVRSEEHTSELQSHSHLVCRLLLEKKKSNDIARTQSADRDRLQTQLDEVRDEVVYLKVKMRKEGSVNRSDYNDVRDRLQNIRSEARGESTSRQGTSTWGTNGTGNASGNQSG